MKPLVPDTFDVPLELRHSLFILRPLTIKYLDADYEAVMSSVEHLHQEIPEQVFGAVWPDPSMTKEDDLADLGWHQVEFKMRSSFTYTVLDLTEKRCIGCVYIFPSRFTDADAEVFFWIRKDEHQKGLTALLHNELQHWMKKWPFKKVSYPFRQK